MRLDGCLITVGRAGRMLLAIRPSASVSRWANLSTPAIGDMCVTVRSAVSMRMPPADAIARIVADGAESFSIVVPRDGRRGSVRDSGVELRSGCSTQLAADADCGDSPARTFSVADAPPPDLGAILLGQLMDGCTVQRIADGYIGFHEASAESFHDSHAFGHAWVDPIHWQSYRLAPQPSDKAAGSDAQESQRPLVDFVGHESSAASFDLGHYSAASVLQYQILIARRWRDLYGPFF
ncbi:hypothetical protein HK105_205167 [Polyrhizophydium stewartii]|uniref:Uncharacterized protein n=1 Tax=Polyrhizophydium stewartii TaxID=2732419 RepID=A0ABR4N6Y8_9FUNG|nr:hypothetical protein HK105_000538 [Polyrhizophydium stewartii]